LVPWQQVRRMPEAQLAGRAGRKQTSSNLQGVSVQQVQIPGAPHWISAGIVAGCDQPTFFHVPQSREVKV
jgi:hypothetical protein